MNATRTARDWRSGGGAAPPGELQLLPAWPARFPWRGLTDSLFLHTAAVGLLYAVSIWPQGRVHRADSPPQHALHGYRLSLYLPELHGAPTVRKQGGKADPVAGRQEIRSLPDSPDNRKQTILMPSKLKLQHDVALPNLVAYKQAPPAPPLDASSLSAVLQHPATVPERVIVQQRPQRALPSSIPQSAPQVGAIREATGLDQLIPPAVHPALPIRAAEIVQLKPQRAPSRIQPPAAQTAPELPSTNAPNLAQALPKHADAALPAPATPVTHAMPIMALSVHPAEVQAPVAVPEGNRRGAFAVSPAGHADATGTPGTGDSSGVGASRSAEAVNAPPGINVGAPPESPEAIASPNSPSPGSAGNDVRAHLLAAMRPPAIASIPPRPSAAQQPTHKPTELENHIFAGRRSYTLVVNMPNLSAAVGSWIIRYVDRDQGLVPVPITTPEVLRKSDPAIPNELTDMHGVVILTAVIRADGTVTDIAVAQSLYSQLDRSAADALSRWIFRPALKNGQPVDLQAVITVPFRTK